MQAAIKHEEKNCPRCKGSFECKAGDIAHCQCNGIQLPLHVQEYIANKYNDCLCKNCLLQLSQPLYFNAELHNNYSSR